MVYKPTKGTYEIDRIMRPLGRVRLRTGTHDKRIAERYEVMLESLPLDTVKLIVGGQLGLREVYDLWCRGEANLIPTTLTLKPLLETMREWDRTAEVSADERIARGKVLNYFEHVAPRARIVELPALLRDMRASHKDRQTAFNRAKGIAMAFVRDTLGRRSEIHEALSDIRTRAMPQKLARHPCTVQEAKAVAMELPKKWAPIWWAMCVTGMGPREYFVNGWTVTEHGVQIHGTKRAARERIVPYVVSPTDPPGGPDAFESALARADVGVAPYDARRTYSRWLQELRLPEYRRKAYMGHGPKSMTELYSWGDIREWLTEDGKALRDYVGQPLALRVRA